MDSLNVMGIPKLYFYLFILEIQLCLLINSNITVIITNNKLLYIRYFTRYSIFISYSDFNPVNTHWNLTQMFNWNITNHKLIDSCVSLAFLVVFMNTLGLWHHKVLQAHLICFLSQSKIQSFLREALVLFTEE